MTENQDTNYDLWYNEQRAENYAAKRSFGVDGFVLQKRFSSFANQIENFAVRDDDVFVIGFQKTGTTWTQELVWCLENDLDFTKSVANVMNYKFPLLEMCVYELPKIVGAPMWDSINYLSTFPDKRLIKTHLPWQLLPKQIQTGEKKPKIVYIYRDPKDTCISLYFHLRKLGMLKGSIEELCEDMLNDTELYCPFWKHVEGYLQKENLPNLFITTYEEMKQDLAGVIRKVAVFLEKPLTDAQVNQLQNHLTYKSMLKNESVNYQFPNKTNFLRSGKTGDHKNYMNSELIQRFENWTTTSRVKYGGGQK